MIGLPLFVPIVKLVWGFLLLSSELYFFTRDLIVLSLSLGKSLLNFDTASEFPFSQTYLAILILSTSLLDVAV